jgi:transposase
MRERERRTWEMFVPLVHPPGHAQADFGEAIVVIGGVEQKAHFFVMVAIGAPLVRATMATPHSDAYFVRAYPAATAEAWMDGHFRAFAFFGGVPQSVLYDSEEDQETIRGGAVEKPHASDSLSIEWIEATGFQPVRFSERMRGLPDF